MTQDEIIRMARECGIDVSNGKFSEVWAIDLQNFAALVAAHEREACVSLRKEIPLVGLVSDEYESGFWDALKMYEKSIRARGDK